MVLYRCRWWAALVVTFTSAGCHSDDERTSAQTTLVGEWLSVEFDRQLGPGRSMIEAVHDLVATERVGWVRFEPRGSGVLATYTYDFYDSGQALIDSLERIVGDTARVFASRSSLDTFEIRTGPAQDTLTWRHRREGLARAQTFLRIADDVETVLRRRIIAGRYRADDGRSVWFEDSGRVVWNGAEHRYEIARDPTLGADFIWFDKVGEERTGARPAIGYRWTGDTLRLYHARSDDLTRWGDLMARLVAESSGVRR